MIRRFLKPISYIPFCWKKKFGLVKNKYIVQMIAIVSITTKIDENIANVLACFNGRFI